MFLGTPVPWDIISAKNTSGNKWYIQIGQFENILTMGYLQTWGQSTGKPQKIVQVPKSSNSKELEPLLGPKGKEDRGWGGLLNSESRRKESQGETSRAGISVHRHSQLLSDPAVWPREWIPYPSLLLRSFYLWIGLSGQTNSEVKGCISQDFQEKQNLYWGRGEKLISRNWLM